MQPLAEVVYFFMEKEQIIKEFRKKRDELIRLVRIDDGCESKITPFGYKVRKGDELFTIVDWGNIEKFIIEAIKKL